MVSKNKDHLNQMHIATKSSKIDISSEQKTEIISRKFSKYLKKRRYNFSVWRNWCWKNNIYKIFDQSLANKKQFN